MPCQCCNPTATTEQEPRSAAREPCDCGADSSGDCRCAAEPAHAEGERGADPTPQPAA